MPAKCCGGFSRLTCRIPSQLGGAATRRIETEGMYRTVCDYIAGMTDRYLMEEFARLAQPV